MPTFDGRLISVPMTQVVAPGTTIRVPGEGMPVEGGSGKGDLVIRFATRFPQTLTPKQKAELKKALAEPKRQPMPEVVKRFFDGTPMTPEKQSKIFSLYAEDSALAFTGHGPPITLRKAGIMDAVAALHDAFPDFTFNPGCVVPEITAEGCWAAKIVVTGTHTGAPYAPAPHLPKVAKTGRSVVIGPETFKLFVNAEGLVVRHEIEVHEPGKPAGPPGFYEGIGGVMLPPPA